MHLVREQLRKAGTNVLGARETQFGVAGWLSPRAAKLVVSVL